MLTDPRLLYVIQRFAHSARPDCFFIVLMYLELLYFFIFSLLTRSYCFFVFVCLRFGFVVMCLVVYTVSWMFGTFGLCVLSWLLFLLEGYGSLLFWLFELVCWIVCIVLSICVALDLGLDCSDALVFIVRIRFLNVWIVLTVYIAS